PRVVVFDDVHWAEPAFLDFVDYLMRTLDDAPLLLVCPTRPDLLEHRLGWADHARATRVDLRPLSDEAIEVVLAGLSLAGSLDPEVRSRLVDASEGNPLFAEQLLSMLVG